MSRWNFNPGPVNGFKTTFNSLSAAYCEHKAKDDDELHGSMSISRRILLRGADSKIVSENLPSPSFKFQKIKFIGFCKEWIKDPLNIALLFWTIGVTVSGSVVFLVMTGMLNNLLPTKSQREIWFEVNNQILTALFTLIWKPGDVLILREIYCKNGTYKPHERKHMTVLLVLLHMNCFAQYALSVLNLSHKKPQRSVFGVSICLTVALSTAAAASLYAIFSPLGKEYDHGDDEESPNRIKDGDLFVSRIVDKPQWRGGLFHFLDDVRTACLSLFCSFCLFGWNMERLGFGNMYVHAATFVIFCTAPLCLFGLAANIVEPLYAKVALSLIGILVSVFGLFYGGYWRIQMRKRFDITKNESCWGKPNAGDCAQWLFCCCCSLAQEVRTADYYELMEDNLGKNRTNGRDKIEILSPLPREGGTVHEDRSNLDSNRFLDETDGVNQLLKPPTPSSMQRDDFALKMTKNLAGERSLSL
ncbi:hypothetical protein SDJN02_03464 [Cucurbita argyrosperma subsp. argyrosperma]|nr:hypothetical protein SDJN02_03464 [Cucurbita argyrosperma subsp. argyrosperma]